MPINGSGISLNNDGSINTQKNQPASSVIFPRAIRTEALGPVYATPPNGAMGANVILHVYGATGNFAANEGIILFAYMRSNKGGASTSNVPTIMASEVRPHMITIYPGASDTNLSPSGTARLFKSVSMPIGRCDIGGMLQIKGTFTAGQGIDCELWIDWIM